MNDAITSPGFEDPVRFRAYVLWESEGRPSGRDREHWRQSEEAARAELAVAAPAKKPAKAKAARKKAAPARRDPVAAQAAL